MKVMNKFTMKQIIPYIVVVIFLLSIPIYTILTNTTTLEDGEEFLFKVEAFDPYDMFRGNYLDIRFEENSVEGDFQNYLETGTNQVYALIEKDEEGFAYFEDISITKPEDNEVYYKTSARYYKYSDVVTIETPTRYYMNEDKSLDAEKIYRENIDNTYVKVRVKDGKMVIVGVYINDELIDSLV